MSLMNEFEGVKKIKNTKNFDIENIFDVLNSYKEEMGDVELLDNGKIIVDVNGNYFIEIFLTSDGFIKIERVIEEGKSEGTRTVGYGLKSVDLSIADRMVDQIYDLLNTINPIGNVVEPITGVKKVMFVKQENGMLRNHFYFTDEEGNKKYEIKENKILQKFIAMNSETREEEFEVQYPDARNHNYVVIKPNEFIPVRRKKEATKVTFNGDIVEKNFQITGDYTANHFNVELNEIVIGAIDCLNDTLKDTYRIEINDLKYDYLIMALTIIIDMDYNQ